jgi:hypothetical protein
MKRISRRVLVVTLAVLILGLLAACGVGASSIERINVGSQESNGVSIKNYNVLLKDSVDWPALSDKDREKIAIAGFNEAQKKIAEDGIHNYNITGNANGVSAFMYDAMNQVMIIYLDGTQYSTVAVTPPEQ